MSWLFIACRCFNSDRAVAKKRDRKCLKTTDSYLTHSVVAPEEDQRGPVSLSRASSHPVGGNFGFLFKEIWQNDV